MKKPIGTLIIAKLKGKKMANGGMVQPHHEVAHKGAGNEPSNNFGKGEETEPHEEIAKDIMQAVKHGDHKALSTALQAHHSFMEKESGENPYEKEEKEQE